MVKTFANQEQEDSWKLFAYGPDGIKGNPLFIMTFIEIEQERKREKERDSAGLQRWYWRCRYFWSVRFRPVRLQKSFPMRKSAVHCRSFPMRPKAGLRDRWFPLSLPW